MASAGKGAGEPLTVSGGTIPGSGAPAFSLTKPRHVAGPEHAAGPVIVSVPHAGRAYAPDLLRQMRHSEQACLRLEDRFVDLLAGGLAEATGAILLVAHAPRALIDLNRAPDDVDWDMVVGRAGHAEARHAAGRRARSGLGLVPRRLPGLGELWKRPLAADDLAARLAGVHQPYHACLASALERARDVWGSALLLDLHSMPPLGPKRGPTAAPDFVVGDRFGASADGGLSALAIQHLASAGYSTAHNRPYAGGYVLDRHAAPSRGVQAIQIEVCRSIYLDDHLIGPGKGLPEVVRVLSGLVRRLADEIALTRSLPEAAE